MAAITRSVWHIPFAVAIGIATSAFGAGPRFERHDSHQDREENDHYRNRGWHGTRASGPGIALQSRALLDKAGTTDFELTTGQLDSSAVPPGNINQVQLRVLRPDGKGTQMEKHFGPLRAGGYFHHAFTAPPALGHGQLIDVKTEVGVENYRGEEGHQDVNLKLQDTVKYRPDIAVVKLDYCNLARPGTAMQISATVAELMGDTGAHGDCLLQVDGKQVDAASGIWIDAGSVVTCRFTHTFSNSGMHDVLVLFQNRAPADYDVSNNKLGGQIQIQNPASMSYVATAYESTNFTDSTTDFYYSASSTVPDKHLYTSNYDFAQGRYFYGQIPVAVQLPIKQLSYSDNTDMNPSPVSYAGVPADSSGPSTDPAYTTTTLIERYDDLTKGWMNVAIYKNDATGAGMTTIDWHWDAGEVTYHSESTCTLSVFKCPPGSYTDNTKGKQVHLASNYSANVVVDDGTAYPAQPSFDLTVTTTSDKPPFSCSPSSFGGPTPGKLCTQSTSSYTSKSGSVVKAQ